MIEDINAWLSSLEEKLKRAFGQRLLFMGLQGSYRRGEAHPQSDIDIVVILDELSPEDLGSYKDIIQTMPLHEKACGFISGKKELWHWPKGDLFQLKNDSKPILGTLEGLIPPIGAEDISAYLKIACSGLYHACVQGSLYGSGDIKALRKGLFFLFQSLAYLRTGNYASTKKELSPLLREEEERLLSCDAPQFYEEAIPYLSRLLCHLE